MKIKLLAFLLCLAAFSTIASAQTTIKLFEKVLIQTGENPMPPYSVNNVTPFATTELYLSCPADATSFISGPLAGNNFIVDNFLLVNGWNVCPGENGVGNCFGSFFSTTIIGQPIESSFTGVEPVNISSLLKGNGIFTFSLADYGAVYGSTEINLTTSCTVATEVCHRNHRSREEGRYITLNVAPSAISAHLAHGDLAGPCPNTD